MNAQFLLYLLHITILCIVYFSAAKLGLSLDAVSGFATAVWPPTGIALVALFRFGYRLGPGIALGAFLANASAGAPILVASGMAVGNTLEAFVGTYLLKQVVGFRPTLERLWDVIGLVALAAGLSTLSSVTLGVTSGWLGGVISSTDYGKAWWTWWLGDAMGDLVVAPLLLIWSAPPRVRLSPRQLAEAGILLLCVVAVSLFVFGGLWPTRTITYPYLLFPVLIWAALRFGTHGAATTTAIVSIIAIWGTARGFGPFASETVQGSLLELQTFMSIVAVTGLVLAAAVAERQHVQEAHSRLAAIVESSDDALERQRRETAFLDRATQLFNSTLQLKVVFQTVAKMATEVLGESCTINLIEEGKEHLNPVGIYHADPTAMQLRLQIMRDHPIRIGDPESVVGLAAADGRPYLVKDVRLEGPVKNAERLSIYSLIAAPILSKGKILGVLASSITNPSRRFTETDLRLATALADRAALAIENSRLYEQEQALRRTMEELNRQLAGSFEQLQLSQRQLLQAEKLASLGKLSAGVAHEILNPLTVVSGRLQLLLMQPNLAPELQKTYHLLLDQVGRITRICEGMRQFARQQEPSFQAVDLNATLAQTFLLLEPELRLRKIAVQTALDPELPSISADEGQLRQIFLNLLTNAMDAMPGGGSLRLATLQGAAVQVVVADTGCGIAPEDLPKIFDPFFTTKPTGTGLGLAVSHGIIQSHGGTIRVESRPGEGTTMIVELPSHA